MSESDDELMQRAQASDAAAFDELVRRHYESVQSKAYKMVEDSALAEDSAQEAFVRLFTGLDRYRAEGTFKSYLFTILKNLIVDSLRHSPQGLTERERTYLDALEYLTADLEREPTDQEVANHCALQGWTSETVHEVKQKVEEKLNWKSLDEPLEGKDGEHATIGEISGHERSPEEQATANLAREPIERALRALGFKGRDAAALVLREIEGWEWVDIDEYFGCPRGYLETRVSRLKEGIRLKLLKEHHQHLDWSAKHAAYAQAWKKEGISPLQHVLVKAVWFCSKDLQQVASAVKCHGSTAKEQFRCVLAKIGDYIKPANYHEALISLGASQMRKRGDSNAKKR